MNDIKHFFGTSVSGVGFLGWVTLDTANKWAALACAVFGSIAAILIIASVIHSWWKEKSK